MNTPSSTQPTDQLKSELMGGEEPTSYKRIRHVWEESPHAHDRMMKWVGWLLGLVLFGIILSMILKKFLPALN